MEMGTLFLPKCGLLRRYRAILEFGKGLQRQRFPSPLTVATMVAYLVLSDAEEPRGERSRPSIFETTQPLNRFEKGRRGQILRLRHRIHSIADVAIDPWEVVAVQFSEGFRVLAGLMYQPLFILRVEPVPHR
jgi:hypothetical protein